MRLLLHNLLYRHDFLTGPGGCFQFCTHKVLGTTRISYSPYEGSKFHPVPKSVIAQMQALSPLTPESVMALLRSAKENY